MKKLYFLLLLSLTFTVTQSLQAQICNANGNVVIFSNYDGGILRINVDQNIPNLKIGIVSYEDDSVIISGAFVGNVTEVRYAGYFNSPNVNCSTNVAVKGVYGVSSTIVTIVFMPSANYSNSNGNSSIICNYSCSSTTNQGGCNTPDQIVAYFNTAFASTNANLRSHTTQYGCWSGTQNISTTGNCCIVPITTGLMENNWLESFSLYPNPAQNTLHIESSLLSADVLNVEIYNMLGEKVIAANMTANGSLSQAINIADLSKGMYSVRLMCGNSVVSKKLVIE